MTITERTLLYASAIAIAINSITIVVLQPKEGPPGFMGPPGPVGEQGPKGDKGDPGDSILTLHIQRLPDEIVPLPKPRPKHLAHHKSEWAR